MSTAFSETEDRLPKIIDAKTHGYIDYCHAALFFTLAVVNRRKNPRAATASWLTGSFVLTQSLLTDYPLGVKPLISFETHGKMDACSAIASLLIPTAFGFEGTAMSKFFKCNAAIEATAVALTDFNSERARTES